MQLKGLQKTTLLDYPGKIAAVVFVAGCNFRCPFCHNSDLVLRPETLPNISEEEILKFLGSRVGKLAGLVITGGEPTLQPGLPEFIKKVKDLGFLVKLDTNGTNPGTVESLIKDGLIDYVAMDYKGPLQKYYKYIGKTQNYELLVKKTIEILSKSGIDFELRTTVVPTLHNTEDLTTMAKEIPVTVRWYLQPFRPVNCLDPEFKKIKPYSPSVLKRLFIEAKKYHKNLELRGF